MVRCRWRSSRKGYRSVLVRRCVTGYDGSISYLFYDDGTMAIEIVIRLQLQVEGIQGVLVGKDEIPGNYLLSGSTYTTEIADEIETGTWHSTGDTLTLNPDGAHGSTVLKNYR